MYIQLRGENGDSALALARLITIAGAVRVKGTTREDDTHISAQIGKRVVTK